MIEPFFRQLVVGVIPQPRHVPPSPLPPDAVQRAFFDISQDFQYQQFNVLPGNSGVQMSNAANDVVLLQPMLLQVQTPVQLTAESAREKVRRILSTASRRLELHHFLQAGIKVIAHVPAPGERPDSKAFLTEQVMGAGELAAELGPEFFGGGIRFRAIREDEDSRSEQNVSIEPFIQDNAYIYVEFDIQRGGPFTGLDNLSGWIDDAFGFVSGPTMRVLEGLNR